MGALSDYVDELRIAHSGERFNIVIIRMTSPKDISIDRTFNECLQREAEEMVNKEIQ